jgi:uncharacterized protein involved in tolerance to divalent cations
MVLYMKKKKLENENTYFMCINVLSGSRSVYGVMWKNTIQQDRSQMTIENGAYSLYAG